MRWLRRGRGTNDSGSGGGGVDPTPSTPTRFRFLLLLALFTALFTCASATDGNVVSPSFNEQDQQTDTTGHDHADDFAADAVPIDTSTPRESTAASTLVTLFADGGACFNDNQSEIDETGDLHNSVRNPCVGASEAKGSSATTVRQECKDDAQYNDAQNGGNPLVVLHNRAENLTHVRDFPFPSMFRADSRCKCKSTTPDRDCVAYYMQIPMDEVCSDLNLHPLKPLTNTTLEEPLDIVYPWFAHEDGGEGHDMDSYGDEAVHLANPDVLAWTTHCHAQIRIPLHRHGPFEFDILGSTLRPPEADNHRGEAPPTADVGVKSAPTADADNTNQADADVNEDTPCEYPERGGVDTECFEHEESSGTDNYEEEYHNCVYGYLRFRVYPFNMRGSSPANAKSRKVWGQNARRRYQIRIHAEDSISRYCIARVLMSYWVLHPN